MATLTYTDLQTRCANELRLPTTNSTEMTKLGYIINLVYRDIGSRYSNWWWLRKHAVVNTVAKIETGTLAATKGDTTITFSSGPTATAAGKVIIVTGNVSDASAVYRILTHTAAATTATLDAAYTGTTVTASAYKLYQDRYDVATDTKAIREIRRYGRVEPLRLVGPEVIDEIKIVDSSEGTPMVAALRDYATTGDHTSARQLIVHPYPDDTYRLDIEYIQTLNTEVSGTTRFQIPDEYAQVLIYGTLSRAYPVMLSDTTRGLYYAGLFNSAMDQMVADARQREGYPTTVPQDTYRRFYHRDRRRGHATLRSQFGRWPADS